MMVLGVGACLIAVSTLAAVAVLLVMDDERHAMAKCVF
jgi:hypothetical protein